MVCTGLVAKRYVAVGGHCSTGELSSADANPGWYDGRSRRERRKLHVNKSHDSTSMLAEVISSSHFERAPLETLSVLSPRLRRNDRTDGLAVVTALDEFVGRQPGRRRVSRSSSAIPSRSAFVVIQRGPWLQPRLRPRWRRWMPTVPSRYGSVLPATMSPGEMGATRSSSSGAVEPE